MKEKLVKNFVCIMLYFHTTSISRNPRNFVLVLEQKYVQNTKQWHFIYLLKNPTNFFRYLSCMLKLLTIFLSLST
jgi:hypothetical protein